MNNNQPPTQDVKVSETKQRETKQKEVIQDDFQFEPSEDSRPPPVSKPTKTLPSPASLANHQRLWRDLPQNNWPRWRSVSKVLFSAYSQASREGDTSARIQALARLMGLPQLALVRGRGGKKNARTHRQLSSQLLRTLESLQKDNLPPPEAWEHSTSKQSDPETARALKAKNLVMNGHISRAAKALTLEGLAPIDAHSCKALAALHPRASDPIPPLPDSASYITIDKLDLYKIAKERLNNGSSPGYSGWTSELILA
jgi:hypothetical protein